MEDPVDGEVADNGDNEDDEEEKEAGEQKDNKRGRRRSTRSRSITLQLSPGPLIRRYHPHST